MKRISDKQRLDWLDEMLGIGPEGELRIWVGFPVIKKRTRTTLRQAIDAAIRTSRKRGKKGISL